MNNFLIEGGTVVDPLNKRVHAKDLLVVDGKFEDLSKKNTQTEIISVKGKYIMPGLFDLRCHLSQPGVSFQKSVEKIGRKASARKLFQKFFEKLSFKILAQTRRYFSI